MMPYDFKKLPELVWVVVVAAAVAVLSVLVTDADLAARETWTVAILGGAVRAAAGAALAFLTKPVSAMLSLLR